jgi:hypothetical protein
LRIIVDQFPWNGAFRRSVKDAVHCVQQQTDPLAVDLPLAQKFQAKGPKRVATQANTSGKGMPLQGKPLVKTTETFHKNLLRTARDGLCIGKPFQDERIV